MRFDERFTIAAGVTHPDPLASPATVPMAQVKQIRKRENNQAVSSNRLILALLGENAESLSIVVWSLDDATDDENWRPSADDHWVRVATFPGLQGGEARQTAPSLSSDAFVGGGGRGAAGIHFQDGGRFYFQVAQNNLTAEREFLARSTV